MMKRARAGASPIGVNLSRCSRAYLSPRQDATRVARRHAVECHPWLREGSDSLDTEILRRAQDDRRGWTVSVALDRKLTPMGSPLPYDEAANPTVYGRGGACPRPGVVRGDLTLVRMGTLAVRPYILHISLVVIGFRLHRTMASVKLFRLGRACEGGG